MTPLGALARGLVASAVGTLAMDTLLFSRYRRGGGTDRFPAWEFSAGVEKWDDAPAPAQVGKRLRPRVGEVGSRRHYLYSPAWPSDVISCVSAFGYQPIANITAIRGARTSTCAARMSDFGTGPIGAPWVTPWNSRSM